MNGTRRDWRVLADHAWESVGWTVIAAVFLVCYFAVLPFSKDTLGQRGARRQS